MAVRVTDDPVGVVAGLMSGFAEVLNSGKGVTDVKIIASNGHFHATLAEIS